VLKAAAKECTEPLQAELLHANTLPVRVAQRHAAPLQDAADIIHEWPKGERVLAYLLEGAESAQVRYQQQAACQHVLRQRSALQNTQLHITVG
jgi:hypothetical protein